MLCSGGQCRWSRHVRIGHGIAGSCLSGLQFSDAQPPPTSTVVDVSVRGAHKTFQWLGSMLCDRFCFTLFSPLCVLSSSPLLPASNHFAPPFAKDTFVLTSHPIAFPHRPVPSAVRVYPCSPTSLFLACFTIRGPCAPIPSSNGARARGTPSSNSDPAALLAVQTMVQTRQAKGLGRC